MMPILSPLATLQAIVTTTCGAASNDKLTSWRFAVFNLTTSNCDCHKQHECEHYSQLTRLTKELQQYGYINPMHPQRTEAITATKRIQAILRAYFMGYTVFVRTSYRPSDSLHHGTDDILSHENTVIRGTSFLQRLVHTICPYQHGVVNEPWSGQ